MWNTKTLLFDKNGFEPEIQLTNWLIENNVKSFVIFERTEEYVKVIY